jgi:Type II secretion system (T2SS), protein E, N-terminal domain
MRLVETRPRLGELLVSVGYITPEQLAVALAEREETNEMLGAILLRRGWIFEDELARMLAKQTGLPNLSLLNGVDARTVPPDMRPSGLQYGFIPVRTSATGTVVALADPLDTDAVATIKRLIPDAQLGVGVLSEINAAWRSVCD